MDASKRTEYRQQLEQLQQALKRSEQEDESSARVELDQSRLGRLSRMDALQDQQISLDKQRRRQHYLRAVEGALRRLENGQFGHCFLCGEPISPERLHFDPTLTRCIDCTEA